MRKQFVWASAIALAVTATSQLELVAQSLEGVILISTRKDQDMSWGFTDAWDVKGPGQASQGDVAMAALLGDHGYSCRIVLDGELNPEKINPTYGTAGDANFYIQTIPDARLVIVSGSGGSSDAPPVATNGVPVMCGEHVVLGDRTDRAGSIFMYSNGSSSGDGNYPGSGQYMKITAAGKTHPIMQGIPLDAQDRVKIVRDPYPEESAHMPNGGKPNFEYDFPLQWVSNAAPATTVLGVLDTNPDRSCFAVADVGGTLADGTTATVRLVHMFCNEGGSGNSRRCFNALTDIGRVLFVRAAQWAMGETLTPYVPLGVIQTSMISPNKIKLEWTGSAAKNYKILGTANISGASDYSNWQTVVQDIPGTNGPTSVKLDISNGPQYAFFRVMPVP
jgi:hypothetical protein